MGLSCICCAIQDDAPGKMLKCGGDENLFEVIDHQPVVKCAQREGKERGRGKREPVGMAKISIYRFR